ncbi:MAG: cytochrome c oxidase assembly protein [Firmicutes bacterium]|nr:cytochrome c oxidase assembly protein [Bacillota bacterium]
MNSHLWLMWTWHPPVLAALGVATVLYTWLVLRSERARPGARMGHPAWTYAGLFLLFLAMESPIDEIGELYLFWVHMLQHMIIAFLAPPLLLLGLNGRLPPVPEWVRGSLKDLPRKTPGRVLAVVGWKLLRVACYPVVSVLLFNGVFTAYHVPSIYQAALADPNLHALEHFLLLLTGCFAWSRVFSPLPEMPPLSYPAQMAYVFLDGLAMTPVFAFITFGNAPYYDWYVHAPRISWLSPMDDQQLGGVVMKLFAGGVYLGVFLRAFYLWGREERAAEARLVSSGAGAGVEEVDYRYATRGH